MTAITRPASPPGNPARARLERARTALLVVDMQEKLLPVIEDQEALRRRTVLLMRAAGILSIPVLLTTQYRKGLGDIVPDVRTSAPDAAPIDKVTFGCFGSEDVAAWFTAQPERDQLLVSGIETHICVMQTVMGALERGLAVHVATDAVGARRSAEHLLGLARMERMGAVLSGAEMAIYELLERAGTDEFRAILRLIVGE
jgi:nicotinamidase-related amidase